MLFSKIPNVFDSSTVFQTQSDKLKPSFNSIV